MKFKYIITGLAAVLMSSAIYASQISPDSVSIAAPMQRIERLGLEHTDLLEGYRYSQQCDSLLTIWHEQRSSAAFESFFNDFIDIDTTAVYTTNIPDSVYEARLKMILSPIQMPYNDIVKKYIIAYTTHNKAVVSRVLGRSQYYFPIIEQELDAAGLPIELRMLPVVESALSPTAKSHMGATGLWQFMHATGRRYGMEITSFIDQRSDPSASTKAACRFLKDLYSMYGDWTLALAAYNCGPGNVNKAIKRAGGKTKNFWDIYPYLPKETRGYVPSFIAVTYAYNFHQQHNIEPASVPLPLATDTLMINRVMHFKQISSTIGTSIDMIRGLNPQYKLDIIPATSKSYVLVLPVNDVSKFIDNEKRIYEKEMLYLAEYIKPAGAGKKTFSLNSFTYKVKPGDTLSGIASKNGVTVSQLMKWNNLKSAHKLSIGQKLEIYR